MVLDFIFKSDLMSQHIDVNDIEYSFTKVQMEHSGFQAILLRTALITGFVWAERGQPGLDLFLNLLVAS